MNNWLRNDLIHAFPKIEIAKEADLYILTSRGKQGERK